MNPSSPTNPDVSVVIPARNEEGYVGAALASVAAQTGPLERVEIVVVDNGSADATADVVRTFAAAQPRLVVKLIDEPVVGVARTKNRGAWAAEGNWLIFMDADSRMSPDLLEQVVQQGLSGYRAGTIRIKADSSDLLDRAFFGLLEFGKGLFRLHAQMFYCERELFIRHKGFREDLVLAEDREFLARLEQAGASLCQVRKSWIATSPRRLHRLPFRISMVTVLIRWALANWGIGRRWHY